MTKKKKKNWTKKKKITAIFGSGGIILVIFAYLSFFQQITGCTIRDLFNKQNIEQKVEGKLQEIDDKIEQDPEEIRNIEKTINPIKEEISKKEKIHTARGTSLGLMDSTWAWNSAEEQAIEKLLSKLGKCKKSNINHEVDYTQSFSKRRKPPDDGIFDAEVVVFVKIKK